MADEHAHSIEFHAPELRDRIHGLWEFTDQPDRLDEIGDPVGGDIEEFIACRDEIVECIRNWVDRRVSGARFPHLDT
jgi:protein-tyrosine-phosphatase